MKHYKYKGFQNQRKFWIVYYDLPEILRSNFTLLIVDEKRLSFEDLKKEVINRTPTSIKALDILINDGII